MSAIHVFLLITFLSLFNILAIAQTCSVGFEIKICQQVESSTNDCLGTNNCSLPFCSQTYINSIAACYYCSGQGNSTKLLIQSCASQNVIVTNPFDDPSFTSSIVAAESTFAASAQGTSAVAQRTSIAVWDTSATATASAAAISGTTGTQLSDNAQTSNTNIYFILAGSVVILSIIGCIVRCCCLYARRRNLTSSKNYVQQPLLLLPVANQNGYVAATQQVQVVNTTPMRAPPPSYSSTLARDSINQAYQSPTPPGLYPHLPELMAMPTPTPMPTPTYPSGLMNMPTSSPMISSPLPPYRGLNPMEIVEHPLDEAISHAPNAYPPLRHTPHTPAPVFANPNTLGVNEPEEVVYKPNDAEETNKPNEAEEKTNKPNEAEERVNKPNDAEEKTNKPNEARISAEGGL